MFYIWWPAYIVPGLMVLAGFAGQLLPGRKYRSPQGPLAPERQKFADGLFLKLLRQFGVVFEQYAFSRSRRKNSFVTPQSITSHGSTSSSPKSRFA